jgi:hypothetical protein
MATRRRSAWILVAVTCLALGTCAYLGFGPWAGACDDAGCHDGPIIVWRSPSGRWAAGSYTFRVAVPGTTYVCVPYAWKDLAGFDCTPPLNFRFLRERETAPAQPDGAPSEVPERLYARAEVPGHHPYIDLSVDRGGTELLRVRRSLEYSDNYVNGPDCGVTCRSAYAEVIVPAAGE